MTIFLSVIIFVLLMICGLFFGRIIALNREYDNLAIKYSKSKKFSNKLVEDSYLDLSNFLKNKKSRLSKESKVELLQLYFVILLQLPRSQRVAIEESCESIDIDNTTLKPAEHKQAAIEALEELIDTDDINSLSLMALNYHICCLVLL